MSDTRTEIQEQRAATIRLKVVAAKKADEWIVRAIGPWRDWESLEANVQRYVGQIDTAIEWTRYEYEGYPSYIVYGHGVIPDMRDSGWPAGVFRFDHLGDGVYREGVRLGELL